VTASDNDALDCDIHETTERVSNYMRNTTVQVKISMDADTVYCTLPLISPEGSDMTFTRTWTNGWTIPPQAVGRTLLFEFVGLLSDVKCDAHPASHDPDCHLNAPDEGYWAEIAVVDFIRLAASAPGGPQVESVTAQAAPPPPTADNTLFLAEDRLAGTAQMILTGDWLPDGAPADKFRWDIVLTNGTAGATEWRLTNSAFVPNPATVTWNAANASGSATNRQFLVRGWYDCNANGQYEAAEPHRSLYVTIIKVELKKLEFTSDHNVICDGATITTAGSRFPNVEWDTTVATPVNAPITHTAGATATDKIALTLTLDVSGIPASTAYTLTGSSAEDALDFSKSGTISSGSDVTVTVVADNAIGADIQKIEDKITWSIDLLGTSVSLGDTGAHVVYTTLGTPDTSAPSSASVPNVLRMDLAVPVVASAITAAGGSGNHTKTVWEIVKAEGSYTLGVSLSDANAWTLPSLPAGADCLSISKFVRNVGMAMGIPGSFDAETYAAYYRTAAEMDRPKKAIAGLSLNTPNVSPGDQGVAATAGLDPSWVIFLADVNCTKFGGGAAPGTVGCGPDGINSFEAAVIYTDTAAKKWYFPGGTTRIYDDIDDIVQIFQTMAWVQYGDHDSNPLTPNVLVVKAVDYTYTTQSNATP
jgi:hypothetical protein